MQALLGTAAELDYGTALGIPGMIFANLCYLKISEDQVYVPNLRVFFRNIEPNGPRIFSPARFRITNIFGPPMFSYSEILSNHVLFLIIRGNFPFLIDLVTLLPLKFIVAMTNWL